MDALSVGTRDYEQEPLSTEQDATGEWRDSKFMKLWCVKSMGSVYLYLILVT